MPNAARAPGIRTMIKANIRCIVNNLSKMTSFTNHNLIKLFVKIREKRYDKDVAIFCMSHT